MVVGASPRFPGDSTTSTRHPVVTTTVARILSIDIESDYSLASAAAYEDAVGRAESLGFTDVVAHWPRDEGIYAGQESVLDEVAGMLSRRA